MLISCRKEGESLQIGEHIEIRIVSVRKNKVTLGVVAPRDMKIATRKLSEMEMANTMAAAQPAHVDQLFSKPAERGENVVFVLEEAGSLNTAKDAASAQPVCGVVRDQNVAAHHHDKKSDVTDKKNGSPDE